MKNLVLVAFAALALAAALLDRATTGRELRCSTRSVRWRGASIYRDRARVPRTNSRYSDSVRFSGGAHVDSCR